MLQPQEPRDETGKTPAERVAGATKRKGIGAGRLREAPDRTRNRPSTVVPEGAGTTERSERDAGLQSFKTSIPQCMDSSHPPFP
jgi:hypothetical protein